MRLIWATQGRTTGTSGIFATYAAFVAEFGRVSGSLRAAALKDRLYGAAAAPSSPRAQRPHRGAYAPYVPVCQSMGT